MDLLRIELKEKDSVLTPLYNNILNSVGFLLPKNIISENMSNEEKGCVLLNLTLNISPNPLNNNTFNNTLDCYVFSDKLNPKKSESETILKEIALLRHNKYTCVMSYIPISALYSGTFYNQQKNVPGSTFPTNYSHIVIIHGVIKGDNDLKNINKKKISNVMDDVKYCLNTHLISLISFYRDYLDMLSTPYYFVNSVSNYNMLKLYFIALLNYLHNFEPLFINKQTKKPFYSYYLLHKKNLLEKYTSQIKNINGYNFNLCYNFNLLLNKDNFNYFSNSMKMGLQSNNQNPLSRNYKLELSPNLIDKPTISCNYPLAGVVAPDELIKPFLNNMIIGANIGEIKNKVQLEMKYMDNVGSLEEKTIYYLDFVDMLKLIFPEKLKNFKFSYNLIHDWKCSELFMLIGSIPDNVSPEILKYIENKKMVNDIVICLDLYNLIQNIIEEMENNTNNYNITSLKSLPLVMFMVWLLYIILRIPKNKFDKLTQSYFPPYVMYKGGLYDYSEKIEKYLKSGILSDIKLRGIEGNLIKDNINKEDIDINQPSIEELDINQSDVDVKKSKKDGIKMKKELGNAEIGENVENVENVEKSEPVNKEKEEKNKAEEILLNEIFKGDSKFDRNQIFFFITSGLISKEGFMERLLNEIYQNVNISIEKNRSYSFMFDIFELCKKLSPKL